MKRQSTNSAPINQHYVSRCHLREFFNKEANRIFLYDKKLDNHYNRQGVGKIFSQDYINNRFSGTEVDQTSMELELRVMFEDEFGVHLAWIKKFLNDHSIIEQAYEHLNFIALMALVGEYRNPNYKQGLDDALDYLKSEAKVRGAEIPDESKHPKSPYNNIKGYIEVASLLLTEMDPITFSIVIIESDDHFVIPDTTGFLVREHLDYGKVTQFGIAVSDKIFVLGKSAKIKAPGTRLIKINRNDDDLVFKINSDLANFAYKTVACMDQRFLKETIDKLKQVRFMGQYFYGFSL